MKALELLHILLLATCLSDQLHVSGFEMAGMRRAIEQTGRGPYRARFRRFSARTVSTA